MVIFIKTNNNNVNNSSPSLYNSKSLCILIGILLIFSTFIHHKHNYDKDLVSSSSSSATGNVYTGKPWNKVGQTLHKRIVAETPFARCDVHTVKLPNGKVVDDWVFLEERDAVNVIVQMMDNGKFPVFEQEKYAIPGLTFSPVGGFIDEGELPYQAAKREVLEELGLGSRMASSHFSTPHTVNDKPNTHTDLEDGRINDEDPDWVFLGYHRTAANRGGGFLYSYLLKNAVPILPNGGTPKFKPTGDDEDQSLKYLSEKEIREAVTNSQFKEIKWAATISLALLHLQDHNN